MDIVTLGNDVLRRKAVLVSEFDEGLQHYTDAMINTMIKGNGIGLAAPQVGDSRRFFVCKLPEADPMVFINPEVIGTSAELEAVEEGCLSIPGVYADIERPSVIDVQAWKPSGRPFKITAKGMLARVILHELDHLNGVLFIDHLSPKKRERLLKLYNKRIPAERY